MLRRLEWTVLRRLDGLLHGDYRTLFRGFGLDLADLREYQYHDDVRHIDWNVTARLQTPYVREYNEDRDVTAWFLLDVSPSVDFGSGDVRKRSVSTDFVTVLARILTRHGNRVGAAFYGETMDTVIPARSGRRHVLQILHRMLQRPRARRSRRATDLNDFLRAAFPAIARRSHGVRRVGFHQRAPLGRARSRNLSQRHEVLAVRLYDPLEHELPDLGLLTMQDAETGEQLFVDTHDRGFRKRFAQAAEEREDAAARSLSPRRRRRARAVDRRRPRRRDPAIRRHAQAPQPPRRRRRDCRERPASRDDVPLARPAVAARAGARCRGPVPVGIAPEEEDGGALREPRRW